LEADLTVYDKREAIELAVNSIAPNEVSSFMLAFDGEATSKKLDQIDELLAPLEDSDHNRDTMALLATAVENALMIAFDFHAKAE
jgi:hypothetical protein